jgi:hypothetical protein
MPSVGFEPAISAGERPTTYALDRAATETGPASSGTRQKCIIKIYISNSVCILMCAVSLPFLETCAPNGGNTCRFCYAIDFLFASHTCAAFTLKPLLCLFTLTAEIGSSVRAGCLTDGVNGQTTFARIRYCTYMFSSFGIVIRARSLIEGSEFESRHV